MTRIGHVECTHGARDIPSHSYYFVRLNTVFTRLPIHILAEPIISAARHFRRASALSLMGLALACALEASAQSTPPTAYPFSWSGVSAYTIQVGPAGQADVAHIDEVIERISSGELKQRGVEAIIVSVPMEQAPVALAQSSDADPTPPCAIAGRMVAGAVGGPEGLKTLTEAAYEQDQRTVLQIQGEAWCGQADAEAFSALRLETGLDGVLVNSAQALEAADLALIRSEDAEAPPWVGVEFENEEQAATSPLLPHIDAALTRNWILPQNPDEAAARSFFSRSVGFAVDHPEVSNIAMMSDSGPLSLQDVTALMLQPGAINVQDAQVGTDPSVFAHLQTMGTFRDRHPAIGEGAHEDISEGPYIFYRGLRMGAEVDEVLVVLGAQGEVRLNVSVVFDDDTILRDAYTGNVGFVSYGQIRLTAHEHGVMLLEEVK